MNLISPQELELYLLPTYFVDSDEPVIREFTGKAIGDAVDPVEKAVRLYYAVRDSIRYNPYDIDLSHRALKASHLLQRKHPEGYCVEKACLLAACARAAGIPARLFFCTVKNHIGVENLVKVLKTDVLVFHGGVELYLEGKWVKATPAFNKELCRFLNVETLEFNGREDSIFQQYDKDGDRFMEYLHDYGTFHDIPHDLFVWELHKAYPHFFTKGDDKAFQK